MYPIHKLCLTALTPFLIFATCALADGDHNDIEVMLDGMKLATDGQVFGGTFGTDGFIIVTDDPGFEGDSGVFTAGTTLNFNIMSPLGLWNGGGFDSLNPATSETLTLSFGPFNATTSNGFVHGFDFVNDASGGFETHLNFILNGVGGNSPDFGIYLLELQLTSNNYQSSDPFWIVFDHGIGERDLDIAVDWVQANLVPVPGAIALFALAGVGACRRRRA